MKKANTKIKNLKVKSFTTIEAKMVQGGGYTRLCTGAALSPIAE